MAAKQESVYKVQIVFVFKIPNSISRKRHQYLVQERCVYKNSELLNLLEVLNAKMVLHPCIAVWTFMNSLKKNEVFGFILTCRFPLRDKNSVPANRNSDVFATLLSDSDAQLQGKALGY